MKYINFIKDKCLVNPEYIAAVFVYNDEAVVLIMDYRGEKGKLYLSKYSYEEVLAALEKRKNFNNELIMEY